jgi:hypothetical protein
MKGLDAGWRRVLGWGLLACLLTSAPLAAEPLDETQVKAAFTFNFIKFTHWPDDALGDGGALRLCLVGGSAVSRALEEADGGILGGMRVDIRHIQLPGNVHGCHLLYVAELESSRLHRTLSTLRRLPILTVSDLPDFVTQGGMIGLVRENSRVRFEVNLERVRVAGLVMEVKLMKLAARVLDSAKGR